MQIDDGALCNVINQINKCQKLTEVLNVMKDFFELTGATHFNYTNLTQLNSQKTNFLKHHNYTEEWVKIYTEKNYAIIDPAIIYSKIYQKTAKWNYACQIVSQNFTMNTEQKELFKNMMFDVAKHNLSNGIAVPIATTIVKQSAFYIVYSTWAQTPSNAMLQTVCFIFNNAFTSIAGEPQTHENVQFPFSPQERELIKLMYDGKERQDIAEIMQLSINTIDTMTKRIFIKMRVNSKMQLMAKIISKGWLGMMT